MKVWRTIRCKSVRAAVLALLLGGAFLAGGAWPRPAPAAGCRQSDLTTVPDAAFVPQTQQVSTDAQEKRVCLTFDDGPSKNTETVLAVLAQEQVPATFFVIAAENNRKYLPLVQKEAAQGHQVGLHSCSHEYAEIYASADAYWADIDALRQALSPYLDVASVDCLRFPGGSTNTVSHKYGGSGIMQQLKAQAGERGYHWVDWNVCADDAVGGHPSAAKVYRSTIEDVDGKDTCVVLMHDTDRTKTTAEALPDIIRWFKDHHYAFCRVDALYA